MEDTIELHGSSGKEFVIKKERLALLEMCEKQERKRQKPENIRAQ